jgi:TRAP-type C4-dicarboxylate transport system permease small subunit
VAKLIKIYEGIQEIINWILSALMIFMLLTLTYQVISRYVSPNPASWPTDTSTYTLVAMGFLGMGYLLRKNEHVAVDLVVNYMKPKSRMIIAIVTNIIGTITCAIITYASTVVAIDQHGRNVLITGSAFYFPKYILLVFVAVGFFFTTIDFIRLVVKHIAAFIKKDYTLVLQYNELQELKEGQEAQ